MKLTKAEKAEYAKMSDKDKAIHYCVKEIMKLPVNKKTDMIKYKDVEKLMYKLLREAGFKTP